MNEIMSTFLLLFVPGLPLLLAFPALRSHLPWPCYIALLPATIIVILPITFSIEIPWLLFGITLGVDGMSQLLLVSSVVLWAISTTLLHKSDNYSSDDYLTTYFLLTLAGNLGVVLANDLMSFFVFLTLTGYGFYALLVSEGGEDSRQSGRVYLSFMILADLVLFEVLLIAAATADDLGFEAVHHAMIQSSSSDLYMSMVLIGFVSKAGLWPLHFWLLHVFRSSRSAVAVLLGGVPVAIGLLGIVRWLPLGEITSPELGIIFQTLGIAAIVYAILIGLLQAQLNMLPVYVAITTTGLYVTALGTGLADPASWNQYGHWVYLFIAFFGIGFALLVMATWWLESKYAYHITPVKRLDSLNRWYKQHWSVIVERLMSQVKFDRVYQLRTKMDFLQQKHSWEKILDYCERSLQRWGIAITVFLLLGIVVVFFGVSSF